MLVIHFSTSGLLTHRYTTSVSVPLTKTSTRQSNRYKSLAMNLTHVTHKLWQNVEIRIHLRIPFRILICFLILNVKNIVCCHRGSIDFIFQNKYNFFLKKGGKLLFELCVKYLTIFITNHWNCEITIFNITSTNVQKSTNTMHYRNRGVWQDDTGKNEALVWICPLTVTKIEIYGTCHISWLKISAT